LDQAQSVADDESAARRDPMTKKISPKASRPHMPGYGLPKGTKGLFPWKWAEEKLRKSHNFWVVTVRPDGRPHVMVVWGLWNDGAFLFSTGSQSRKAKNLALNSRCIIATEQADKAVIVEGIAEVTTDVELRRWFLKTYEKKYRFDMSMFEPGILSLKEPIFLVRPNVAFGLDQRKSLNAATRWHFE
jgi:general stress protein 26